MLGRIGKFLVVGSITVFSLAVASHTASAKDVTIKEVTNHYSISGKTAPEFAVSMSKRGPYSRQHRSRAWATASRDMSYQLVRRQTSTTCKIKRAKVTLEITYTLPKLASTQGIRKSQRKRWNQMYGLLNRHEKVHGKFYKQFAQKVQRSLMRMKPQRNCRALDREASKIVERLNEQDRVRNDRFDRRDRRNYRRMTRLYSSG